MARVKTGTDSKVWIVMPAWNEARVIRNTIDELRSVFPNVVVVDDGSRDATADEAVGAGAVVLRHPLNLGQGAAIQTGLDYVVSRGADYVATFDADGQHHVDDLVSMLDVLRAESLDIVLGSRFLGRAEGLTRMRSTLIHLAALFTWLTTGVRLTDAHNGLRIMTGETAMKLRILQNGMAHASEMIAQIGSDDLRVKEVPVTITYSEYSLAKGQKMSNSLRIVFDLLVGWLMR